MRKASRQPGDVTRIMPGQADLGRGGRLVAACLAGLWLAGGLIALVMGVSTRPGALPIVLGLLALGYGWLWVKVALTGRRQHWLFGRRASKEGAP
jgi:hypothetical protein